MLLVKAPTDRVMQEILQGLLDRSLSRTEVVTWHRAVLNQFGQDLPLSIGYWYFHSFSFLDIPLLYQDRNNFFIRDIDLEEYLLDIEKAPAPEVYGNVSRLRSHQIDASALRWPLTTIRHSEALTTCGFPAVRGSFEDRGDMVEHTHLMFDDAMYLIVHQFDEYADQSMLLGTDRDADKLAAFVAELDLEPYQFR
jgi:hypothetical protein